MILKGSQRAGGKQLAHHLLNTRDNDHVVVHEVSGFVSEDVTSAFNEAYAISRGTRCKQYLFSLSLNPPETELVPVDVFEAAIVEVEKRLGLSGQPRAVIFHEKEGRRHAHCVWSRIDAAEMKAVHLSHFKHKLTDLSRELYLEHSWQMPPGLKNKAERDPQALSLSEWQQAKRAKADPRLVKRAFQDCWSRSDGLKAFQSALKDQGYTLAQGDRRGHVAIDWRGEVFAVSKWVGVKAKQVRERIGDPRTLPAVADVKAQIAAQADAKLSAFAEQADRDFERAALGIAARRAALVSAQRMERSRLKKRLEERKIDETKHRASKLPRGLKALWFRLTGKYDAIKMENERELADCERRDRDQWQAVVERHLNERRQLRRDLREERSAHKDMLAEIDHLRETNRPHLEIAEPSPQRRRRKRHRAARMER